MDVGINITAHGHRNVLDVENQIGMTTSTLSFGHGCLPHHACIGIGFGTAVFFVCPDWVLDVEHTIVIDNVNANSIILVRELPPRGPMTNNWGWFYNENTCTLDIMYYYT